MSVIHLDEELSKLKSSTLEMARLAKKQINKAVTALYENDKNLALEIRINEKRLNAIELQIDKECENILALYTPVASDLRLVFSVLKINSNIERMGDNAESIAKNVLNSDVKFSHDVLELCRIEEMRSICSNMIDNVCEAFANEDTKMARSIFEKDFKLNEINKAVPEIIAAYIEKNQNKGEILNAIHAINVVRKLERVGDCVTNIAEEVIFQVEAKVLRHGGNKIKKSSK